MVSSNFKIAVGISTKTIVWCLLLFGDVGVCCGMLMWHAAVCCTLLLEAACYIIMCAWFCPDEHAEAGASHSWWLLATSRCELCSVQMNMQKLVRLRGSSAAC